MSGQTEDLQEDIGRYYASNAKTKSPKSQFSHLDFVDHMAHGGPRHEITSGKMEGWKLSPIEFHEAGGGCMGSESAYYRIWAWPPGGGRTVISKGGSEKEVCNEIEKKILARQGQGPGDRFEVVARALFSRGEIADQGGDFLDLPELERETICTGQGAANLFTHHDARNGYVEVEAVPEKEAVARRSRIKNGYKMAPDITDFIGGGLSMRFLLDVFEEVARARGKFPNGQHNLAALYEEAGELSEALMEIDFDNDDFDPQDVWDEAVQTAAMALRTATEGDSGFSYDPEDLQSKD